MKKLSFALLLLFLYPKGSPACQEVPLTRAELYARASIIIVGKIVGGTFTTSRIDSLDYSSGGRLSVERQFKGSPVTEVTINEPDTFCGGYSYRRGETYLLYGYLDRGIFQRLHAFRLSEAADMVKYLEKVSAQALFTGSILTRGRDAKMEHTRQILTIRMENAAHHFLDIAMHSLLHKYEIIAPPGEYTAWVECDGRAVSEKIAVRLKKGESIEQVFEIPLAARRCIPYSGYPDLEMAWAESNIVILGRPRLKNPRSSNTTPAYSTQVEKTYKGNADAIEFYDLRPLSKKALNSQCLIFLQKTNSVLTVLHAIPVNNSNIKELEEGINLIAKYNDLSDEDQRKILLNYLNMDHRYVQSFIIREILAKKVTDAIPYFQQKLSRSTSAEEQLDAISNLRVLGNTDNRNRLSSWLADDAFRKTSVIREMGAFKDKSFIPEIRKYINNRDEFLAVEARAALLILGEFDAKRLLFEMIGKSKNEVVRYRAISPLLYGYQGAFTEEEETAIRALAHDQNRSIGDLANTIATAIEIMRSLQDQKSEESPALPGAKF
jgi:hypothetical protein